MNNFDKALLFHTLCCLADKMLKDRAITLKEYYFLIKKLSQNYLTDGNPPPNDEEKGGDM